MEAIILAGGMGTRLKSIISDVPKPMAPIGDNPFLWYVLEYLYKQNINKVILSVGYKHEYIKGYFGGKFHDMKILYSIENKPLGTGGAIKRAFEKVESKEVFILNGDTLFNVALNRLSIQHHKHLSDLTIALKPMQEFERYGAVVTSNEKITKFEEKGYKKSGLISGGIYLSNANLFDNVQLPLKFSFEKNFIEKYIHQLNINAFISDTYFIDIGIPDDYERAQKELREQL